ncbi:murein transglycosylase A [Sphingomicrobium nitratireducens]|uniref:murein transglycosylase A n=1 Tax=Sphingomicrobium nitratireducens TaxID=2964666 RepID=UPI00223F62D6|nr:murein transglycosylase A [Sphingomicrobium nitratireducens]
MRLRLSALAGTLFLTACATRPVAPPPPVVTAPSVPASALALGVSVTAAVALPQADAERALFSFRRSCPKLLVREDVSGLTEPGDWAPLCAEAAVVDPAMAATFFATRFSFVKVGDGSAFATGYFEPEIAGCRMPRPGCDTPIHALPKDLTRGTFTDGSGEGRGRTDENGDFVLYHDRAAIDAGALDGRGLELAYAADPVDLFFLHIQGSGRVRFDDGSVMRIGYAGQNGRSYVAIGKPMKERGLIDSPVTMQKIKDWLRANPREGRAIMEENPSYIFFRELTGEGPIGAMDVAVTPRGTVAADPRFVPLGAPVWLDLADTLGDGLWVAQDTGGAIKGANRFDTFWGAGPEAAAIAGGFSKSGSALLLLPKGAAARAQAQR